MFGHIQDAHNGECNRQDVGADWKVTLGNSYRKPLERQVGEYIGIRKAKTTGRGRVGNRDIEIDNQVFNSKEEWYSHTSQWDTVG